ncbi:amidase family protein [Amycolatopsis coloradensis]|uniref:Amidase family protein n=1 Tax=Amycolatopsis coloradensis TaxID=76021 RepID=A0ACD5BHU8_9PSEU
MTDEYRFCDMATLRDAFARGELSPVEHVETVLARIETVGARLGAFITVDRKGAMAAAEAAATRIRHGGHTAWREAPLLGIPISVKDLIATKGLRTTRGSWQHRDWIPDFDPPVVERLRAAGAVLLGKTATSEFGWSGSGNSLLAGPVRNPWNLELTSGGSSGGAAAAVAAGLGAGAVGTDGAGSVRIPAAFCGVVGFKPSFGSIPYVPTSPENLSHLGPLTRSVSDTALMMSVMAGADARDVYSYSGPPGEWDLGPATDRPLRIGWIRSFGRPEPEVAIERIAYAAVAALGEAGHTVREMRPPCADPYHVLETILAAAEAAGAGEEPVEHAAPGRLEVADLGRKLSAIDLARAERDRGKLADEIRLAMADVDVLAMPTVPIGPFSAERHQPAEAVHKGRLSWLSWTPATYPFNLTGQPAVSVPAGFTERGIPVGVQLVGRWRADSAVLAVARDLERIRPWAAAYGRTAAGLI